MSHADNHVIVRVWCVMLTMDTQMSAAAEPACKRNMCCVLEARVVQMACMATVAGLSQQRREQMDGDDTAWSADPQ